MRPEVKKLNPSYLKPCPSSKSWPNASCGPVTAPTSKSATVRFIIRYVVRLRKWRFLAKVMRVKTLIITIKINSPIKNSEQELPSFKEGSSLVSLAILREKLNFFLLLLSPCKLRIRKHRKKMIRCKRIKNYFLKLSDVAYSRRYEDMYFNLMNKDMLLLLLVF